MQTSLRRRARAGRPLAGKCLTAHSTNGVYDSSKVVSVANGLMTFTLHTEGSTA